MNGRNRRRKDVPFNPFAQNAAAERNRRHAEKAKEKRRLEAQNQSTTSDVNSKQTSKPKTLEDLKRQAQQNLSVDGNPISVVDNMTQQSKSLSEPTPVVNETKPTITNTTAVKDEAVKSSREDRLAELKRKSQQSKDNAKLSKANSKPEVVSVTETIAPKTELEINSSVDTGESVNDSAVESLQTSKSINVFKTIQSVDKSSAGISKKKRKTRRIDKKGGGRQRLEKKLNRQKILEFKYVAREILAHPDIPEEHRSNILGQIIAKGERISIDAAMEFIDQKNEELILTDEISDKLRNEIKSIATRR